MIWVLCVFALIFSSCQQNPQERHYTEITIEAPQVNVSSASAAKDMFSWDAPPGWKQEAGEGIRLATFHLTSDAKAIDCSIISLGGMAGGLESNLRRWMGQISIQASAQELSVLINSAPSIKIKSGQEAKIFDFTTIQVHGNALDKSMVAAMISIDNTTVFVKMTGSIESVKENKNSFLKLIGSIVHK